jgi:hypothetical protein
VDTPAVGVEQHRVLQQTVEDGRPTGGEGVVRHVGILGADGRRVLPVASRVGREDRQIGVHEQCARDIVRAGLVDGGQPDQPGDLGHRQGRRLQSGQDLGGEQRAVLFVVPGAGEVHRVVEPGGEPDGRRWRLRRAQHVERGQHLRQVLQVVIATVRLGPSPEQRLTLGMHPLTRGR